MYLLFFIIFIEFTKGDYILQVISSSFFLEVRCIYYALVTGIATELCNNIEIRSRPQYSS